MIKTIVFIFQLKLRIETKNPIGAKNIMYGKEIRKKCVISVIPATRNLFSENLTCSAENDSGSDSTSNKLEFGNTPPS